MASKGVKVADKLFSLDLQVDTKKAVLAFDSVWGTVNLNGDVATVTEAVSKIVVATVGALKKGEGG